MTAHAAPTRGEYLRILSLRILRGETLDPSFPAEEIAEARAIAEASGLKVTKVKAKPVAAPPQEPAPIVGRILDLTKRR